MSGPIGRKMSRARIAAMIRYLTMAPRTKQQVARFSGISRTSAGDWLNLLHKTGCIHVCAYTQTLKNGMRAAIYAWGHGDDVKKPRAKTSAERVAKVRDRSTLERAWRMPQ